MSFRAPDSIGAVPRRQQRRTPERTHAIDDPRSVIEFGETAQWSAAVP